MEITELLIKTSPVIVISILMLWSVYVKDVDKKIKITKFNRHIFIIHSGLVYLYYQQVFPLFALLILDMLYVTSMELLYAKRLKFMERMDEMSSSHVELLVKEVSKQAVKIVELETALQQRDIEGRN